MTLFVGLHKAYTLKESKEILHYGKKFNQSWIVSLLGFYFPTLYACENIEGIAVYDGCNDMQLQAEANEDKELYCICQREEEGLMILCDNEQCPYRWFHASCVSLDATCIPQDKWYCTLCCN